MRVREDGSSRMGGPIKVMRIMDRLNIGGPAIHAVLTTAHLDPRRFRTTLVHGDIEPDEGDMSHLLEHHQVRAVRLSGLSRNLRPIEDLRALLHLYRLMRAERPHVVHTHKTKAGLLGRLAALLSGVPVRVHTYHGHVLTGYFDSRKTRLLVWMERLLGKTTSRLITVSEQLRVELSQKYHIAGLEQIQVVPLGLDLRPYRTADALRGHLRRELGYGADTPLIGVVGRMVPIKDHETFVQALSRLCAQRPDIRAVLVGSGESEADIRAQVSRLGLSRHVHFLGWRHDLPSIYADLDLLTLTSRNEGTPVAVIEALAAGVPVVATCVGGVPDVLRDGLLGELVPPGDAVALAGAMKRVLDDPGARGQARSPARRDEICALYGIERLCADLGQVYESELRRAGISLERRKSIPWADEDCLAGNP